MASFRAGPSTPPPTLLVMEVVYSDIREEQANRSLVEACLEEIEPRLLEPDRVRLVVAGRFEDAVQARVDYPEGHDYNTERLAGVVGAKTIKLADGSVDILLNGSLIKRGVSQAGIELYRRLAAHEAYHAVIHQRSEDLPDIQKRHQLEAYSEKGVFGGLAGCAAEEFRVERAVGEDGMGLDLSHHRGLPDVLEGFRARIMDGINLRYPNEPIDRCMQTVITGFHQVTMALAYIAADEVAGGPAAAKYGEQLWGRLVGDHYDRFRDGLARFPSASTPSRIHELDRLAFSLALILQDWLEHVGFTVKDMDEGFYFDVLTHDFAA
jgi:hypothetical protein